MKIQRGAPRPIFKVRKVYQCKLCEKKKEVKMKQVYMKRTDRALMNHRFKYKCSFDPNHNLGAYRPREKGQKIQLPPKLTAHRKPGRPPKYDYIITTGFPGNPDGVRLSKDEDFNRF